MSRHESVSCDSCMRANFKGRRYKCLVCYDYDLCATCHEAGVITARHSTDHPMQCILTRTDFDLYYGGDSISSDHPQSFTCPYCGQMGYTESSLTEHVSAQHLESAAEVICPICAALPGGDPNLVSDDFHAHLALEHRGREPFEVETVTQRNPRRFTSSRRGQRSRHYNSNGDTTTNSNPTSLAMDPIAELLSHLSGVHPRFNVRNAPQQLRDIQRQIEAERALRLPDISREIYREQIQRFPSRRAGGLYEPATLSSSASNGVAEGGRTTVTASNVSSSSSNQANKTLLSKYLNSEKLFGKALEEKEKQDAVHCLFLQDVLLATLTDSRLSLTESKSSEQSAALVSEADGHNRLSSLDDLFDSQSASNTSDLSESQQAVKPKTKNSSTGS